MNHRRQLAAALACAMAVCLCAGHVFADGTADHTQIVDNPEIILPADSAADAPEADTGAESNDPSAAVESSSQSQELPSEAPEHDSPLPAPLEQRDLILDGNGLSPDLFTEDADGTVSFEKLESRLREHNLNILSLDESINSLESIDLDEMEDNLQYAISMLSDQQTQLERLVDGTTAALDGLQAALDGQNLGIDVSVFQPALVAYPQGTIASLEAQIATYRDTLEQIRNGSIEDEYGAAISQMMNAQDQIVMGAQTLYLSLLGLEQTQQGLERNLAALDRTLAQLEVRYEMGQISALTLAEAKAGRTSLVSGMDTLSMNMTALRRQLEGMLGEEITGTIQLQPLSAVTADQLSAMNYDEDIKSVRRNSYDLFAANKAWTDADEDYDKIRGNYTAEYEVDSAWATVRAAKLSLDATKQNIELSFSALCDQVKDQQQVLSAARTSLSVKKDALAAAQLKYEQGTISYHALMEAQDTLADAQDTVDTAAIDLFTYYNNYRWAVKSGILN